MNSRSSNLYTRENLMQLYFELLIPTRLHDGLSNIDISKKDEFV